MGCYKPSLLLLPGHVLHLSLSTDVMHALSLLLQGSGRCMCVNHQFLRIAVCVDWLCAYPCMPHKLMAVRYMLTFTILTLTMHCVNMATNVV